MQCIHASTDSDLFPEFCLCCGLMSNGFVQEAGLNFSWPEGIMKSLGQLRRKEREALGRGRAGINGWYVFFLFNFFHCSLGITPVTTPTPCPPSSPPSYPLFRVTKASLGESKRPAYQVEAGQSPYPLYQCWVRYSTISNGFQKSVHLLKISPGPTASSATQQIKQAT